MCGYDFKDLCAERGGIEGVKALLDRRPPLHYIDVRVDETGITASSKGGNWHAMPLAEAWALASDLDIDIMYDVEETARFNFNDQAQLLISPNSSFRQNLEALKLERI